MMLVRARVCLLLLCVSLPALHATPAGFTTFFDRQDCPAGWFQPAVTKGRLILSVSDGKGAGITVNAPFRDQEDRTHSHSWTSVVPVPDKSVAAIDCCNDSGMCHDNYPVGGTMNTSTSGLPFAQLIVCQLQQATADAVPFGTVAFFDSSVAACPANFAPYAGAGGRFIIPGYSSQGTISSIAAPLSSGQDLVHKHSYLTTVKLTDISYAGVEGCCNDNPAAAGVYNIDGTTDAQSFGLPYVQLLTCVSNNATFDSNMPSGTLLFNQVACPPNWNVSLEAAGRLLVGVPDGAQPGITFGSNSFPAGYTGEPTHNHFFSGGFDSRPCGVGLASGCCGSGYAGNGHYDFVGQSDKAVAEVPFLSVPMCVQLKKDDQQAVEKF